MNDTNVFSISTNKNKNTMFDTTTIIKIIINIEWAQLFSMQYIHACVLNKQLTKQ